MTKSDIRRKLAMRIYGDARSDSLSRINKYMDALSALITDALISGDKVKWRNLMTIKPYVCKQHNCIIPSTGELYTVPEQISVMFIVSNKIKKLVNLR